MALLIRKGISEAFNCLGGGYCFWGHLPVNNFMFVPKHVIKMANHWVKHLSSDQKPGYLLYIGDV